MVVERCALEHSKSHSSWEIPPRNAQESTPVNRLKGQPGSNGHDQQFIGVYSTFRLQRSGKGYPHQNGDRVDVGHLRKVKKAAADNEMTFNGFGPLIKAYITTIDYGHPGHTPFARRRHYSAREKVKLQEIESDNDEKWLTAFINPRTLYWGHPWDLSMSTTIQDQITKCKYTLSPSSSSWALLQVLIARCAFE